MNELEFDARIRSGYRARVEAAEPVPDGLWQSVLGIPDDVPNRAGMWSRRPMLILAAAAMLTALLAGTIAAIGSGLLPIPWPDESRVPRVPSLSAVSSVMVHGASPCDLSLPAGVVLQLGDDHTLFADGLLVRREEGDFPRGAHEQRRMSSTAVEELLTAVESSGLGGCRIYQSSGQEVGVLALTNSGIVSFGAGATEGTYYVASEEERLAAARIAARLADPDLGIADEHWAQLEWSEFPTDIEVQTRRFGPREDQWGTTREGWAEIVMPDGNPITSYGLCRVVTEAEAREIGALLGPPVEESSNEWSLQDSTGGILVTLSRVGAGEEGCQRAAGPDDRTNLIEDFHPCDFNPPGWGSPDTWEDFGSGWAACESLSDGWTFVGRHPVTSYEAEAIIRDIFGVGVVTDVIGTATVYFNACEELDSPDCVVAISAEPYLLVVDPDADGADLRALAEGVIAGIDR
jgi:hypothetical protein